MKLFYRLTILLLAAGTLWLAWEAVRAQRGLEKGQRCIARGAWPEARRELSRYLRLHPGSAPARLLLAEAFARDETPEDDRYVQAAIEHLGLVPDASPLAAQARTQEGRLRFLILDQPVRGERLFRHAIELDPENYDANLLLWKLLETTGRLSLTEPIFWRVVELCPPAERPLRMREWYLSEFNPASAARPLDEMMGFFDETDTSGGAVTEVKRLKRFRAAEPESPLATAALARLMLRHGLRELAQEVLESAASLEGAFEDPYYVAAWIALSIDLGEFNRAEELFGNWPGERSGFEYWKWEGIICDEIRHDDGCAAGAFERLGAVWPGALDWQLMYRRAHCLARTGALQQADEIRERAHDIELMMDKPVHDRLRKAMAHLDDPQQVAVIVDFYQKLQRPREVEFWKSHQRQIGRMKGIASGPPDGQPGAG